MQVHLNTTLLSTLPRVLRLTHAAVADASGISIACWYRIAKNPQRITVQQLLSLANGLHIPVSRFFIIGHTDVPIGGREDYIMDEDYLECYYDSEAISRTFGEGTATSWREAAQAVGMHWIHVSSCLMAVSRTPIIRLLTLCDTFNFNLFDFLIDPNYATKSPAHQRNHSGSRLERNQLDELSRKVAALSRTVDTLTSKYEELLRAYCSVASRLEVNIKDITNSHLSFAASPHNAHPHQDHE